MAVLRTQQVPPDPPDLRVQDQERAFRLSELVRLTYADEKYGLFLSAEVVCDYLAVKDAVQRFQVGDRRIYKPLTEACSVFQKGLLPHGSYLWSLGYTAELRNGLTDSLQLIAASEPEEKDSALRLLSQLACSDGA